MVQTLWAACLISMWRDSIVSLKLLAHHKDPHLARAFRALTSVEAFSPESVFSLLVNAIPQVLDAFWHQPQQALTFYSSSEALVKRMWNIKETRA